MIDMVKLPYKGVSLRIPSRWTRFVFEGEVYKFSGELMAWVCIGPVVRDETA